MTLVVDSGVAAKWILPEDGADRAAALRDETDEILAPSLIAAEIGNAIWKRVTWQELSAADALRALEVALGLITRLVPIEEVGVRAMKLAIELRHPIYDCFYLALAEREQSSLITADTRLLAAVRRMKGIDVRAL